MSRRHQVRRVGVYVDGKLLDEFHEQRVEHYYHDRRTRTCGLTFTTTGLAPWVDDAMRDASNQCKSAKVALTIGGALWVADGRLLVRGEGRYSFLGAAPSTVDGRSTKSVLADMRRAMRRAGVGEMRELLVELIASQGARAPIVIEAASAFQTMKAIIAFSNGRGLRTQHP